MGVGSGTPTIPRPHADMDVPRILSQLLGQPDEGSLPALEDMLAEQGWLAAAIEELRQTPLEQWQAEHTRLFINGFPKTACPPYLSIQRHDRMDGPVCDELAGLYRRAGLAPIREVPADYLGTLLEFATWLSEQETGEAPGLLRELRDRHLAGWLPDFAGCLRRESRLMLYRDLGLQLESWLSSLS